MTWNGCCRRKEQKEMTPDCPSCDASGVISLHSWYLTSVVNLSFYGFDGLSVTKFILGDWCGKSFESRSVRFRWFRNRFAYLYIGIASSCLKDTTGRGKKQLGILNKNAASVSCIWQKMGRSSLSPLTGARCCGIIKMLGGSGPPDFYFAFWNILQKGIDKWGGWG